MLIQFTEIDEAETVWINPETIEMIEVSSSRKDATFIRCISGKGITVEGAPKVVAEKIMSGGDVLPV